MELKLTCDIVKALALEGLVHFRVRLTIGIIILICV